MITGMSILAGRGDGTFRAARAIDPPIAVPGDEDFSPLALAADFNGDGTLDVAVLDGGNVYIYPGRGDLTFSPRVALPQSGDALAIALADLNHDGRPDIAATTTSQRVDAFLNQGGLVFSVSSVPLIAPIFGLATGDLNHDNNIDLVVAGSFLGQQPSDGMFYVLLGNGNGTFQPPVARPTGVGGAMTVAVADFNHDGSLDVATGNRSWREADTSCSGFAYWDSVTIVSGLGNGDFAAPSSFRLGTSNDDEEYRTTHNALVTADLNGDGWPDLVTSPAAILLTHAPTPNHAPIVSAGPDQMKVGGDPDVHFDAIAFDADNDWLEFEWRDSAGRVVGRWPHFCGGGDPGTYTVTVTDGHGGTATDSMVFFNRTDSDPVVEIVAPRGSKTVSIDAPYAIRWVHSNDAAVVSYRVLASADDGRTFTPIAGCANLPATASVCVWSNPRPVSTIARVEVEAYERRRTVWRLRPPIDSSSYPARRHRCRRAGKTATSVWSASRGARHSMARRSR